MSNETLASNEVLESVIKARKAMFDAIGNCGILTYDSDKGAKKFEKFYTTGDFNELGTFNRMVKEVLKNEEDAFCMSDYFKEINRTYITLGVHNKWRALFVIE